MLAGLRAVTFSKALGGGQATWGSALAGQRLTDAGRSGPGLVSTVLFISFVSPSRHPDLSALVRGLRLGWVCSCFPGAARRRRDCLGNSSAVRARASEHPPPSSLPGRSTTQARVFVSPAAGARVSPTFTGEAQSGLCLGLVGLPRAGVPPPHPCLPSPARGSAHVGFPSSGWGCGPPGVRPRRVPLAPVFERAVGQRLWVPACSVPGPPARRPGLLVTWGLFCLPHVRPGCVQVPESPPDYRKYYRQRSKVPRPPRLAPGPVAWLALPCPCTGLFPRLPGASRSERHTARASVSASDVSLAGEVRVRGGRAAQASTCTCLCLQGASRRQRVQGAWVRVTGLLRRAALLACGSVDTACAPPHSRSGGPPAGVRCGAARLREVL